MCRFTINEPQLICNSGYGFGNMAPGLHLEGDGIYQCGYVLLKAHARAYRIYDEEFRPKYNGKRFWIFEKIYNCEQFSISGQVGLVINVQWGEAVTNSTLDLEAQERYLEFVVCLLII